MSFTTMTAFLLILLAAGVTVPSADTLYSGTISSGYGTATTADTALVLHSTIGAPVVGSSQSEDGIYTIHSGYFTDSPFHYAIVNEPPRFVNIRDTLFPEEDSQYTVTLSIIDPDNDPVTCTFIVLPSYFDTSGTTLTWKTARNQTDTLFTAVASDGTLSDTVTVQVHAAISHNLRPVITSKTKDTTFEGSVYSYTAEGVDSEGVALSFSFTGYPSWMGNSDTLDGPTISGIPPEGTRSAQFTVIARDDRWTTTARVSLTIRPFNSPPVFTCDSSASAEEDSLFTYTATARDPDASSLMYFFTDLPSGWKWMSSVENDTVFGDTLAGIPLDNAGTSFMVYVNDDVNRDSMEVRIRIKQTEDPPKITSHPFVKVKKGTEAFIYPVNAYDPEGGPVYFSYEHKPGWCSIDSTDSDSIRIRINTLSLSDTLTDFLIIRAEDATGLTDSLKVTISIVEKNTAPVITSSDKVEATEDSLFGFRITVSDSDDTKWTFSYGNTEVWPPWLHRLSEGNYGRMEYDSLWGVPDGSSDIHRIHVVVSDGGDVNDTLELIIKIKTRNDPPQFKSTPNILKVTVNTKWEYHLKATDPERNDITFRLKTAPEGMEYDQSRQTVVWTPASVEDDPVPVTVAAIDHPAHQPSDTTEQSFFLTVVRNTSATITFGDPSPSADSIRHAVDVRTVCIHYDGAKIDSTSLRDALTIKGSENGDYDWDIQELTDSTLSVSLDAFPVGNETVRVRLSEECRDINGNHLSEDYGTEYRIAWPGDFNYDSTVDFDDISYVTEYWNASALNRESHIVNIGPASGKVPHLRLTDTSSRFDFEDLSVFLSMWRYHASASVSPAPSLASTGNSTSAHELLAKAITVPQRTTSLLHMDDFTGAQPATSVIASSAKITATGSLPSFDITLTVNDLKNLVTGWLSLVYDNHAFGPAMVTLPLYKSSNGEVLLLHQETPEGADFQFARLCAAQPGVDGNGVLATISLPLVKNITSDIPVGIAYKLVATNHRTVAEGKLLCTAKQTDFPVRFAINTFIAGPNPARHAPQLAPLKIGSLSDRNVALSPEGITLQFSVAIPENFTDDDSPVSVEIAIYDCVGNRICKAVERNFLGENSKPGYYLHRCHWDCRTTKGFPVAPGIYSAQLVWRHGGFKGRESLMIGVR